MKCRFCGGVDILDVVDLGKMPPSNAYLAKENLAKPETYLPLKIFTCKNCWLVQTEDYAEAQIFFDAEYAYFSSASTSWLQHAKNYADSISHELKLTPNNLVVEIASNDGYLLTNFKAKGIPCLGIEPTGSTANAAEKKGLRVIREFFGSSLARRLRKEYGLVDLIIGNNVYAHVPDINDFTAGMKIFLSKSGTITLEFPHLLNLIELNQWDTFYHEHFSYYSLHTVCEIFKFHKLKVYKIEILKTHGGSLRVFGCHQADKRELEPSVKEILNAEKSLKLNSFKGYETIQQRACKNKNDLIQFLINQKNQGKKVVAYGAAAKGNTLLNFAGIKTDLLPVVFDKSPSKQNKFLPGSNIPILHPDKLIKFNPDVVLILPWNIKDEILAELRSTLKRSVKYVITSPEITIL